MHAGNLVVILHTHLPYVLHHGDWPHGTDWICEAVAECYIPLLNEFHALRAEGVSPKVTLDISPVLCDQLEHKDFPALFEAYCDTRIRLAREDEERFLRSGEDPHMAYLAQTWQQWYARCKDEFVNTYGRSIVTSLRRLQEEGHIEVMTCGATHAYLPLVASDKAVRLQIRAAVANYVKHFGCKPRGIWLPECAYRPSYTWKTLLPVAQFQTPRHREGLEQILHDEGLKYFVVDEHAVRQSRPLGVMQSGSPVARTDRNAEHPFDATPMTMYNVASSAETMRRSCVVFARDTNIAMQVWSGEKGYPGDPAYLDFHKKHHASALRYWRVTDVKADMQYKLLYVPEWTQERVRDHAFHFTQSIERTALQVRRDTSRIATICTPFDTELFGHWWFEGPRFLGAVLRGLHMSPYVHAMCASENISALQPKEFVSIPESSWGKGGHHEVWMNDNVKYMWESLYAMELEADALVHEALTAEKKSVLRRIARQALREFMLAQASDWEFLISTNSAADYAQMRFHHHRDDFSRLVATARRVGTNGRLKKQEREHLQLCEERNAVFAELELEWWS